MQAVEDRIDALLRPEGDCILWTGYTTRSGYAKIKVDGRMIAVHRIMYERHKGPIPAGLEIDHLCRNKRCVNPDHLEAVTHAENIARILRGRTTCKRGHPWTDDSARRGTCRKCHEENNVAYRRRRGQKAMRPREVAMRECTAGHALTPDNIQRHSRKISCRTCNRARASAYYWANRERVLEHARQRHRGRQS